MDQKLYSEIENYIKDIIEQNASVPNYKLPSERMLSLKFDVSREPIRHAYENLVKKVWLLKTTEEAILSKVMRLCDLQAFSKVSRSA